MAVTFAVDGNNAVAPACLILIEGEITFATGLATEIHTHLSALFRHGKRDCI